MFLLPYSNARQREAYRERRTSPAPSMMHAIHRVFVADGVYVITLLVFLVFMLVTARPHFIHRWGYEFIWLNLFLAGVPYGISLCADVLFRSIPQRGRRIQFRGLLLLPLFALWLLFLPNAPYVLTDFIHLRHETSRQVLYDTVMLGTYTVTGYAFAGIALAIMQRQVRARCGKGVSRVFVIACCFLAGIGVQLGRTEHYNSWDAFSQAKVILGTILDRLVHLYSHPYTLLDGLYYGALMLAAYGAFLALGSKEMR